MTNKSENLSIVVIGASGDLARKKIFPALFALYCQKLLPSRFNIYGFARTAMTREEFRNRISEQLLCRYVPRESCDEYKAGFLARCFYMKGDYASADSYLNLYKMIRHVQRDGDANTMFHMAIPPAIFLDTARAIGSAGLIDFSPGRPWTRVVVEKPFGRDRESSDILTAEMARVFTKEQTYRMDHYLGKEVIQNLLVLRFANLVFEPLWNRNYIENVRVSWKENIGIEGRGGYFDAYGIIRDVMQNHLMQILALTAMEPPVHLDADHVRTEKVRLLRAISPLKVEDVVTGQYAASARNGLKYPAYAEETNVAPGSVTPTFAAAVLKVDNPRWKGVPFLVCAGKGLDARMTEIRVRFRPVPNEMFCRIGGCPGVNELVIRVQPDEAIYLTVVSKVPGLHMALETRNLDLRYKSAFSQAIPDAYECLLLDVIEGDKSLFIRSDELEAAWDVFTPLLRELDRGGVKPEPYEFLSRGPASAGKLAAACGMEW